MKLFRVISTRDQNGLWYDADGNEIRVVDQLTNKRLAELPMGLDPMYREQGKKWFCAAWSLEHLVHWFDKPTFLELLDRGYIAIQFDSDEYIVDENQVRFTKEGMRNDKEITQQFYIYLNEQRQQTMVH